MTGLRPSTTGIYGMIDDEDLRAAHDADGPIEIAGVIRIEAFVDLLQHGDPSRIVQGGDGEPLKNEKYVLRMSNPVVEMDGIVEEDGFSVTIPGSLSLSRAGPIAAAHPDVEHASILNRGDFSELTIRFVAGRQPAYRVEARGPAVELTISR